MYIRLGNEETLTSVDAVIEKRPRRNVDAVAAVDTVVEPAVQSTHLFVFLLEIAVCNG